MASVAKRAWTYNGVVKSAWVVRYTDEAGDRRMRTFAAKKDADRFPTRVETEVESGLHVPDRKTATVREVCSKFRIHLDQRAADGRIGYVYSRSFDAPIRHLTAALGRTKIKDLTVQYVEKLYADLSCRTSGPTACH